MVKYSFIFLYYFCFFVLSYNNGLKIQNNAVLLQISCYNTFNMELYDMHCHLLPHIDDGFVEWSELGSYLDLYKSCGFSGLIFTPHLYDPYVTTDVKALREAWVKAKKICEEKGLFSSLASEIYVLDEEKVKGLPVMGRYALVEFPTEYAPSSFFQKLESLYPLVPIITHIERYKWLSPESDAVAEMRRRGYLIQVNAKALAKGGKAEEYVLRGLVDILASDCHGEKKDIVDLAQMISSHPDIMRKMSLLARHLKEVV